MLRHIGMTRRQILGMLAAGRRPVTALGIAARVSLLGWCISLILVFIVNPQSFHWTMQMSLPWKGLLTVVASTLTGIGRGDRAGIGPPCGFGKRNTCGTGGLVMHIRQMLILTQIGRSVLCGDAGAHRHYEKRCD